MFDDLLKCIKEKCNEYKDKSKEYVLDNKYDITYDYYSATKYLQDNPIFMYYEARQIFKNYAKYDE